MSTSGVSSSSGSSGIIIGSDDQLVRRPDLELDADQQRRRRAAADHRPGLRHQHQRADPGRARRGGAAAHQLQDTISALTPRTRQLSSIQDALQTASLDALDLGEPSLFFQSQTVTSSNTSLVTATATQNIGAVIGSTTLSVAQLASASQATFGYTAPTSSSDTLTIGNDQGPQTVDRHGRRDERRRSPDDINGANNGDRLRDRAQQRPARDLLAHDRGRQQHRHRRRQPDHAVLDSRQARSPPAARRPARTPRCTSTAAPPRPTRRPTR